MAQADRIVGRENEWKSVSICTKSIRIVESILHIIHKIYIIESDRVSDWENEYSCEFIVNFYSLIFEKLVYLYRKWRERGGTRALFLVVRLLLLLLFVLSFSFAKWEFYFGFIPFCEHFVCTHRHTFFRSFHFIYTLFFVFHAHFTISM